MKVYLAAPYVARDTLRVCADELVGIGITVTSSWLRGQADIQIGSGAALDESDEAVREHCRQDFADVAKADTLVVFTGLAIESMRIPGGNGPMLHTGGRHVETGYALARDIPVIVIGDAENVFHRGCCTVVSDWHAAVLMLVVLDRALSLDRLVGAS